MRNLRCAERAPGPARVPHGDQVVARPEVPDGNEERAGEAGGENLLTGWRGFLPFLGASVLVHLTVFALLQHFAVGGGELGGLLTERFQRLPGEVVRPATEAGSVVTFVLVDTELSPATLARPVTPAGPRAPSSPPSSEPSAGRSASSAGRSSERVPVEIAQVKPSRRPVVLTREPEPPGISEPLASLPPETASEVEQIEHSRLEGPGDVPAGSVAELPAGEASAVATPLPAPDEVRVVDLSEAPLDPGPPGDSAETAPDIKLEAVVDTVRQAAPEPSPKFVPESAPDVAPEAVLENDADGAPDADPAAVTAVVAETASSIVSEAVPVVADGVASDRVSSDDATSAVPTQVALEGDNSPGHSPPGDAPVPALARVPPGALPAEPSGPLPSGSEPEVKHIEQSGQEGAGGMPAQDLPELAAQDMPAAAIQSPALEEALDLAPPGEPFESEPPVEIAEIAPDVELEVVPDTSLEQGPETTPDTALDLAPETAQEDAPEPVPVQDVTKPAAGDSPALATVDTTFDADPGPGSVAGNALESALDSSPKSAPDSAPEADLTPAPGNARAEAAAGARVQAVMSVLGPPVRNLPDERPLPALARVPPAALPVAGEGLAGIPLPGAGGSKPLETVLEAEVAPIQQPAAALETGARNSGEPTSDPALESDEHTAPQSLPPSRLPEQRGRLGSILDEGEYVEGAFVEGAFAEDASAADLAPAPGDRPAGQAGPEANPPAELEVSTTENPPGATQAQAGAGDGSDRSAASPESREAVEAAPITGPSYAPPRVKSKVAPTYPNRARRQGAEGSVVLQVDVDENGNPTGVEILRSSGRRDLDAAAEEAVRRWQFYPALEGERPVRGRVEITVTFQLK